MWKQPRTIRYSGEDNKSVARQISPRPKFREDTLRPAFDFGGRHTIQGFLVWRDFPFQLHQSVLGGENIDCVSVSTACIRKAFLKEVTGVQLARWRALATLRLAARN